MTNSNSYRTIKFIVKGQIMELDPACDISDLVPGTEGYLQAEFSFSKEWDSVAKIAAFHSAMGREYEPQVLARGNTCLIPEEALAKKVFKVSVMGRKDTQILTTNRVAVCQNGGKK